MTSMNSNIKDLGNSLYSGALIAGAIVGSRAATKSLGFKDRPLDVKMKSLVMLAVDAAIANYVVNKLNTAVILPAKIFT